MVKLPAGRSMTTSSAVVGTLPRFQFEAVGQEPSESTFQVMVAPCAAASWGYPSKKTARVSAVFEN